MNAVLPIPDAPARWDEAPLRDGLFDLLVVGGGIHGAGVARDAALRGLSVLLVERGDWACGTSSRSSKLLHGGLRYLREGDLGLVRESLRERDLHLRLAPDGVRRLRFRIPRDRGGAAPSIWTVRAGVLVYDLLTLGRSRGGVFGEPAYDDARIDDARFCLDVVEDARRHGATLLNYVAWLEWTGQAGRVGGARIRDRVSGREITVHARTCVNAAGPWAGELIPAGACERPRLRLTRGTHVVLDRRIDAEARLFFSGGDGRVLFLIPGDNGFALLGTTDLDEADASPDPAPLPGEIRYLAASVRMQFPELAAASPVAAFTGLRPLVDEEGAPSAVSREERIVEDPASGLISILGGKYTTYRATAERVVDRVLARLGRPRQIAPTHWTPLPTTAALGHPRHAGELARRAFDVEDAVLPGDVVLRRVPWDLPAEVAADLPAAAAAAWGRRWSASPGAVAEALEAMREDRRAREAALRAWHA